MVGGRCGGRPGGLRGQGGRDGGLTTEKGTQSTVNHLYKDKSWRKTRSECVEKWKRGVLEEYENYVEMEIGRGRRQRRRKEVKSGSVKGRQRARKK